jgi:hypothetical protein
MGPAPGIRMSKTRIRRSTPAVATMLSRYLFQSCVRASLGGTPTGAGVPMRGFGGVWMGMLSVRWFDALAGVRRSKTRRWLSELTLLTTLGACGLNCALYVQEWVGSVVMEALWFGFQILTVPSHDDERKVSFETRFQCTLKTSRACSVQDWIGNCATFISKSFTLPSPPAVRICDSCASDQAVSKRESCVSNL